MKKNIFLPALIILFSIHLISQGQSNPCNKTCSQSGKTTVCSEEKTKCSSGTQSCEKTACQENTECCQGKPAVECCKSKSGATCQSKACSQAAQTTCPVMGGTISKDIYADFEGQRIYFCCAGCIKTFEKDPQNYLNKLKDSGIKPEKSPQKS